MKHVETKLSPKERILSVAAELFYKQGFRATGINEVIKKSGVAKATFFAHYPSKEDLGIAYLAQKHEVDLGELEAYIKQKKTPLTRFMSVIEAIELWLIHHDFRGCAFLHMVTEEPNFESPLRQAGVEHYETLKNIIKDVTVGLIESDKKAYKHLQADKVADNYMVILMGAVSIAEVCRETWPIRRSYQLIENLIKP